MTLRRLLRPRRTIWPTRDGWWCLAAASALGVAGMNTANNLLYLLASLLLALVVVSGMLSEQSMRRLQLVPVVPDELFAGRPLVLGARVRNGKRWVTSYGITLEPQGSGRRLHVDRLAAGAERVLTWEVTLPARGRRRLPGVRVTTRFPFGFFFKAGPVTLDDEVVVFPAVTPVTRARLRETLATGTAAARRRGRGQDLHDLREYQAGDDPRLIHWRSSAKSELLVVRELEAETTADTRIVLEGSGTDRDRLERALSEAASLACALLGAGAGVEMAGPGLWVELGRGRGQARRILTALALYDPVAAPGVPPAARRGRRREIRVALG
jgi:uncharacterized protein (DUF58 family)